jgi:hypothetical protein
MDASESSWGLKTLDLTVSWQDRAQAFRPGCPTLALTLGRRTPLSALSMGISVVAFFPCEGEGEEAPAFVERDLGSCPFI